MPIELTSIEESSELKNLNITLSKINNISLSYVADAADETEAKQRANDIADRVAMLLSFNSPNQGYCSPPLVWNPVTKVCE